MSSNYSFSEHKDSKNYYTNVPPLDTFSRNPEMFCNLRRSEPYNDRCLKCLEKNCKHAKTQTVFERH